MQRRILRNGLKVAIKHVEFDDYGYLDGTSVASTYATILTLTDDVDVLFIFNTCDQSLILSIPSKLSTKEMRLPAKCSFVLDCRANSKRIAKGLVRVKYASAVPTSGEISVTAVR